MACAGLSAPFARNLYGELNKYPQPGQKPLPSNWFSAVDLFSESAILKDYLGERFVRMYSTVKRTEQARFFDVVTALDFDWYLANA